MTVTLDWAPMAQALAADLRAKNAIRSDTVAAAVEAVPRHLFIAGHYAAGPHTPVNPAQPTDELLRLAYADRGIMTHTPADGAGGFSSTSQPSIVAKMLEAAGLRPGMQVLEVGAGTGWNAALIAHITGADVPPSRRPPWSPPKPERPWPAPTPSTSPSTRVTDTSGTRAAARTT